MALFALSKWKDKYLFKEQMPAAHGPCQGPQLQSGWQIALLGGHRMLAGTLDVGEVDSLGGLAADLL